MSNGVTYYYVILAVNAAGSSTTPASASVKPYTPITPQELAVPRLAVGSSG